MHLEQRPDVSRLSDTILAIEGPKGGRFPYCNSFLITGHVTVLIDAGIGEEKIREIDAHRRIDILVISHSHPDHILAWQALSDRKLMLPRQTPDSVTDLTAFGQRLTGAADKGAYWEKVVGGGMELTALRKPNGRFGHKTVLKMGDARLEAIHAPGHLDDHYCFFERDSGTLLTTDIDFSGFGPWYGNPESDLATFEESVRQVMALPYRVVASSHRPPIRGDATEAFEAFLDGFRRHRDTILALCSPPRSLQQMVALSPFYRNRMPDKVLQRIFEEPMIRKNLDRLIAEGRVQEKFGQFRRVD